MDEPEDIRLTQVDQLVRSYLDQQIAGLETSNLRARIELGIDSTTSLDATAHEPADRSHLLPGRSSTRRFAYGTAIAAALAVAFVGGRYLGPRSVSAATLLQTTREVHSRPIDRCYHVHYAPDDRYWDGTNKLLGPSHSVLWSRGDRFLADCQVGDLALTIGRDADGLLWISSSRKKGLLFEGSDADLPSDLATLCAINSMSLRKLIDDVLADFDFESERRESSGQETTVIWASLKPGRTHPLISAAVIEVGGQSNAIRRLVIWTLHDGRPNGTVTYTWIENARQPDAFYSMTSHLDSDAVIDFNRRGSGSRTQPPAGTPAPKRSSPDVIHEETTSR